MSDQQAMMAQQNPQMAQQLAMQNPQLAQQAMAQRPDVAAQIMPGAMAAATSGTNAPNVSPPAFDPNSPEMRAYGMLGKMGQGMMAQHPQQGALAAPMSPRMAQSGQIGQMAQKMPGALYQVRPSRIY